MNYLQHGCNIFNDKKSIGRPISIWNDKDIWEYINKYNLSYCDIYDKGETHTGCAYCGFGCHLEKDSRFDRLKNREPKRYNQMMSLENNGVTYKEALDIVLKASDKIFWLTKIDCSVLPAVERIFA